MFCFPDAHDVIAVKMFEQEFARVEKPGEASAFQFILLIFVCSAGPT